MPPEVLEKLLAKLDQADPITKEDLLKAILGETNTSLDISKEIKKVISNVDALAELEIERTFSKVNEKVSSDVSKILSKLDLSVESESKNVFSKLENVLGALGNKIQERTNTLNRSLGRLNSSSDSLNRLENTVRQLSQKFAVSVPKIEPLKVEVDELPMRQLNQKLNPTDRFSESEITLSKKSISDLKKLFGGLMGDSFKDLNDSNEKNGLKLRESIKGLPSILAGSSGLLDVLGIGSLIKLLKPLTLVLGTVGIALSLFAGSFGNTLSGIIDKAFGTNLSAYTRVFQKIVPVQYTDFFTKWGSFLLSSKIVNSEAVQKIVESRAAGATIGSLAGRGAKSIISKTPLLGGIYNAVVGKAPELPLELLGQSKKYKDLIKFGMTPEEATNVLKTGAREEAPAIARGASRLGGNVLTTILTKLGITATEKGLMKIPFGIGALFGLGFGLERISKGDYISGMLSIASGIAAAFPGAGTAVSLGIDALDIFLQWKAPEWKKSTNKFLWTAGLKNVPIISFFRNLGYHFESGRPWLAMLDIMRLVPGMDPFAEKLQNLVTTEVETKAKATGKFPNFMELANIVRRNMWKIVSPHIPEMWGMKKWFAQATGLTGEDIPSGEMPVSPVNPEVPPYKPFPSSPKNQDETSWKELHKGEHFVSQGRGKGMWVKDKPLPSLWNTEPRGFSADEEFNKINAPSVFENPQTDIKNYMSSLNEAMFSISNNFKNLNQTFKESSAGSSVVSIDNSTQGGGGNDDIIDHILRWRKLDVSSVLTLT